MKLPFPRIVRCLAMILSLTLIPMFAAGRSETAPIIEKPDPCILINVFGGVEQRGSFPLPLNSTLLDAIGMAGGWTRTANPKKVSIVRGPAGQKPVVTVHDVEAILRGDAINPKLEDHDSIFVPEKIF